MWRQDKNIDVTSKNVHFPRRKVHGQKKNHETEKKQVPAQSQKSQESKKKSDYQNDVQRQKFEAWESYQVIRPKCSLSKVDKEIRQKIFVFLLKDVRPPLNLLPRTVEHAVKILDMFESIRYMNQHYPRSAPQTRSREIKTQVYPERDVLLLDLIVCLFLACKYNEIYPPDILDIKMHIDEKISISIILEREMVILETLGLNLNMALVSDWYWLLKKEKMPLWAYLCYLDFDLKDKSRYIVEEIDRYFITVNKADAYRAPFKRISEKCADNFIQTSLKLYNSFVMFRVSNNLEALRVKVSEEFTQMQLERIEEMDWEQSQEKETRMHDD